MRAGNRRLRRRGIIRAGVNPAVSRMSSLDVLMRKLAGVVLALMLLMSAAGAAGQPAEAPVSREQRVAVAQDLALRGENDAAEQLWGEIAAEARSAGDEAGLDQAQQALAALAFLQGRYEAFRDLQQGLLERAQRRGDAQAQAQAWLQLALLERRVGRLEAARTGIEGALALFRDAGSKDGEAESLTHLGLVLLNQGAFSEALEALDRSLALQRSGARAALDRTYHYYGLLYLTMGDLGVAREHLEHALEEAGKLPDPMRASPLLGSLARVANEQGLHQDALGYAQRAADLSRRFNSGPGLVYSALERGRALLGLGQVDEARAALQEAEVLGLGISQERTVADARFSLGRLALREGDRETALARFEQSLPVYVDANDIPQMLQAYRIMAPLLRDRGDTERALDLTEASLRLQEQISGRDMSRRVAMLEHRHQVAESERRIELLTRDNEIQALRLRSEALARWFTIAVLAGVALVSLVLAIRYRESRKLGRHLAGMNRELLASRESLASAHAELEQRNRALHLTSITDPLMGIFNRGHVFGRLYDLLEVAGRGEGVISLLLFDVDHFKRVNDDHGHVVGDAVLRRVARIVGERLPPEAVFGRFGGEEFIVVLPGMEIAAATSLGEALRRAVDEADDPVGPAVSISVGVASARTGTASDHLIESADQALYRAKRGGRNRVEAASAVLEGDEGR